MKSPLWDCSTYYLRISPDLMTEVAGATPATFLVYGRNSNTRLNGVSVARRKRFIPAVADIFRNSSSGGMVPSATDPDASAFGVQHNTDAPEKTLPTGLKFYLTFAPAIGSTTMTVPSSRNETRARFNAPRGSPISCRQSKNAIKSNRRSGKSFAGATSNVTRL